jgi:hypothetical protein
MARCAIELLLNTAARRGDTHLLGRQHLRDGVLTWRPQKTPDRLLSVDVEPELAAAINALHACSGNGRSTAWQGVEMVTGHRARLSHVVGSLTTTCQDGRWLRGSMPPIPN